MKKTKIYLFIGVIILLLFLFSSCAAIDAVYDMLGLAPSNADQAYRMIERETAAQSSYEISGKIDLLTYIGGIRVTARGEGKQIYAGLNTEDDFYHLNESEMHVFVKDVDTGAIDIESRNAYYDGKVFLYSKDSGGERKIYSLMTAEEYIEYITNTSGEPNLTFSDLSDGAADKSFSKNNDGGWTVKLSGYNDEALNTLASFDEDFDYKAEDITIEIHADKDLRCTKMLVSAKFDSDKRGEDAPYYNMEFVFSSYNNAVMLLNDINPKDYNEVLDVRLLDKFDDAIDAVLGMEENTAFLTATNELKLLNVNNKLIETDTIKYGVEDGKYFYDIVAIVSGQKIKMRYHDGALTVMNETDYSTVEQSELEARAYVASVILMGYSSGSVNGIKLIGNEKYEVSLEMTGSALSGLNLGNPLIKGTHGEKKVIFTFDGDDLVKVEVAYTVYCVYTGGSVSASGTLTGSGAVEFGDSGAVGTEGGNHTVAFEDSRIEAA